MKVIVAVLPVVAPEMKLGGTDVAAAVVPETVSGVAPEVDAAYPESPAYAAVICTAVALAELAGGV